MCGQVSYIRDRNGNLTSFQYENPWSYNSSTGVCTNNGSPNWLLQATDSLGRKINIAYGEVPGGLGSDVISFTGYSGLPRQITVQWTDLGSALKSGSLQTYEQLFGLSGVNEFDTVVASSVRLPNGQSYNFQYNPYGELVSVTLPTGGAYQYDWGSGYPGSPNGALLGAGSGDSISPANIYRRVLARRVYSDGNTLVLIKEV